MNKTALRQSLVALGVAQPELRPAIRPVLAALVPKRANMNVPRFRADFKAAYLRETLYQLHVILESRFWIDGYQETASGATYSGHNKEQGMAPVSISARSNEGNMTVEVMCSCNGQVSKIKVGPASAKQAPDAFAVMIVSDMTAKGMI